MPETPTTDAASADPAAEPESSPGEPPSGSPPLPRPGLHIAFEPAVPDVDPPAAGWLEGQLRRAAAICGVRAGSLAVTLIDDAQMSRLHAEHCGDPSTTDVLTFDLSERGLGPHAVDGDLVVCRDEAVRQAAVRSRGHDARTEILLYAVHGMLHLLGEDDQTPEAYEQMHRREDEIFAALGLGAVFAAETNQSGGDA